MQSLQNTRPQCRQWCRRTNSPKSRLLERGVRQQGVECAAKHLQFMHWLCALSSTHAGPCACVRHTRGDWDDCRTDGDGSCSPKDLLLPKRLAQNITARGRAGGCSGCNSCFRMKSAELFNYEQAAAAALCAAPASCCGSSGAATRCAPKRGPRAGGANRFPVVFESFHWRRLLDWETEDTQSTLRFGSKSSMGQGGVMEKAVHQRSRIWEFPHLGIPAVAFVGGNRGRRVRL